MTAHRRIRAQSHIRAATLALAGGLFLAAPMAAPTAARAADAPSAMAAAPVPLSASEMAGRRVTHDMLARTEDFKPFFNMIMTMARDQALKSSQAKGGDEAVLYQRFYPWISLGGDAAWEAFVDARPRFEKIIGRYLAAKFTADELDALDRLITGPVGHEMFGMLVEYAKGHTGDDQKLSADAKREVHRFEASPEGRSLKIKFEAMAKDKSSLEHDPAFRALIYDLMGAYVPGFLRRWGEKTEASEAAREADIEAGRNPDAATTPPPLPVVVVPH